MLFNDENNKLHYDLDFLEPNKHWKPVEDTRRMEKYAFAREEFELTPEDMVERLFPSGLLNLKDCTEFGHSLKLLGYPRLLTLKTADMVIGEPPLIVAQADADKELTEKIREMRNRSQFDYHMKQALFDYSRFGVLLIRVFKDEDTGKACLTAWNPLEWVPVYYNDGTNRIKYNVIGWYENPELLKIQIHDTKDGSYEERYYIMDGAGNIVRLKSSKKYNKKSGKKLFFAIPNTPTTTNPLGTGDYEIINSLMQKAIERLTAILRVLDEHADPSMTGPSSLLEKTDSGELVFKTSKYYAVNDEEQKPEYITWEANLESSFKAFDKLCEQIYILSEMGSAFIGAAGSTGNVVSGTAMRFKMVSPLEKARRIANDLTQPFKEIVSSMLSLDGVTLDAKDINITWKDSLPKDPKELVELSKAESGSTVIKPLVKVLQDNFGLDEATANKWIEEALNEKEKFQKVEGQGDKENPVPRADKKLSMKDPATSENLGGSAENLGKK